MKTKSPTLFASIAVGLGLMWSPILSSCGATGAVLTGTLASMASNMLGTAKQNFAGDYAGNLEQVLAAMLNDTDLAGTVPAALLQAPIQLDVGLVKAETVDGVTTMTPITNGMVLRDGRGVEGEGDDFKVTFESASACHVYVLSIDGTGWATPIFPSEPGHQNPVTPNRQYQIPGGNEWFWLDQYRGVETIYFVASNAPRPDLDEHFANLQGMERPEFAEEEEVASVEHEFVWDRGIGGRRQGKGTLVTATNGQSYTFNPTSFMSAEGSADLLITRWFSHQ